MSIIEKNLALTIEQQEKNTYCGQSVIQAIGNHYGMYKSQEELFQIARAVEKDLKSVDRSTGMKEDDEGTGHIGMIVMAKSYGFEGFIKNGANFSDVKYFIDRNIPILIDWQLRHSNDGEHGHYSILSGYKIVNMIDRRETSLTILDPLPHPDFNKYNLNYQKVMELWYDIVGNRVFNKWMAAFYPEDMNIKPPSKGLILKN
jgi:hypothetical protein